MAARIAWVTCGTCGNPEASVSENAAGTLSVQCHKCQFSGFAKAGSKAARLVRAAMIPDDDAAPPKAPEPAPPKAPPEPAKKPASSVFDLGQI